MKEKTALNKFLKAVKNYAYPNRIALRLRHAYIERQEGKFFKNVKGVIHVGGNVAQAKDFYAQYDLNVLWIEPIPGVYQSLVNNISGYPKQKSVNALITDRDGVEYDFHIANNGGQSSSILDLKRHAEIWPKVKMTSTLRLKSQTLDSITAGSRHLYDALVLDTQGSELLVLKGASETLKAIRLIKTEAADFEVYENCATEADLTEFLSGSGFQAVMKSTFASAKGGGSCFDLIFTRSLN